MKTLLFALFLSFPLFAADEFVAVYHCVTPQVADSGYQVLVETGGIAGITQVKLSANSFVGAQLLGNFVVRTSKKGETTIYTGKDIKLIVGKGEYPAEIGIPHKVYNATFIAKAKGVVHKGKLQCWSPQDPQ